MFSRFVRAFWGEMTKGELIKFSILSATLMLILGDYWMLRTLKNALFNDLVGYQHQPFAKILSVFFIALVVLFYSKLVDMLQKHNLFYLLATIYGVLFVVLGYLSGKPELVSLSSSSSLFPFFSWIPGKALGWTLYLLIESFGSVIVVLFWSLVASTTKAVSAKKGYGMILFFTQIGTITGPFLITAYAQTVGSPFMFMLGGVAILITPFLVKLYMTAVPAEDLISDNKESKNKAKTGFLEGLKLLFTRPYVLGIFAVATFYEVVGTILEFQMNMIATTQVFVGNRDAFAAFGGKYGMSVNTLALLFALLGTSFFMRKFGLRFCLLAFPTTIALLLVSILLVYTGITQYTLMWFLFVAMVAIKGLSYALNNPTKEIMYIPTSKDVKFKAKGWIDMFGNRSTKGVGAGINAVFSKSLSDLLLYGTIVSLGVVGIWILIASFVGKTFNKLEEEHKIVE